MHNTCCLLKIGIHGYYLTKSGIQFGDFAKQKETFLLRERTKINIILTTYYLWYVFCFLLFSRPSIAHIFECYCAFLIAISTRFCISRGQCNHEETSKYWKQIHSWFLSVDWHTCKRCKTLLGKTHYRFMTQNI